MGNRIHNTAFNLSLLVLEVSGAPAVLAENLLYLLHVVAVLLLDHRQRLVRDNLRLLDTRKPGGQKTEAAGKGGWVLPQGFGSGSGFNKISGSGSGFICSTYS
jgi:hypothetical protein